ncbi:hypothetical protein VN12_07175 [Pirellula sp. SH-Sr6A]|nr:hypothetical protein VN12_07175 [Pirellula sp. SH-Sr6A]
MARTTLQLDPQSADPRQYLAVIPCLAVSTVFVIEQSCRWLTYVEPSSSTVSQCRTVVPTVSFA